MEDLEDLEDYASQLAASRFLSQAYPILSATMRSSSAAARQRCCPEITISDGKWGAILELLAAITRVLTSRMKKRLRLWLTKLINLLVYANYIDIKWRVKNCRNLKEITKSSRRNSKCASLLLDFLFFVIAYSSHRLTANLHFRLQEHRMSLKYCCCAFVS